MSLALRKLPADQVRRWFPLQGDDLRRQMAAELAGIKSHLRGLDIVTGDVLLVDVDGLPRTRARALLATALDHLGYQPPRVRWQADGRVVMRVPRRRPGPRRA